jgi:uncharacterized protein (TIGR02001 family)
VTAEASATLVSDYRFRGVSLSERAPALQANVEARLDGWFAGAWASTTREHGDAGVEADLYGGWRSGSAGLRYSLAAYAYFQPGRRSSRYVEVQASAGRDVGSAALDVELSYAPAQQGSRDNLYLGASAALPVADSGVTLRARGGFEHGFYRRKRDWELGAAWSRSGWSLGGSVVGSSARLAHRDGGTGLVLSLGRTW